VEARRYIASFGMAVGVTFGLFADPQGHVVGVASDDTAK